MNNDIHMLPNHCKSLLIPRTTKQKINEKPKSNPVSVSNLSKQLNIHGDGHLLEHQFNESGRFFMYGRIVLHL